MDPTVEQQAIMAAAGAMQDNLLVEALAGTGKTTSILLALQHMPAISTLICAFNKRIADEMVGKVATLKAQGRTNVKTLHAIGLQILRSKFKHLMVDNEVTEKACNAAAEQVLVGTGGGSFPQKVRRSSTRLLRHLKETQADPQLEGKRIREIGNADGFFEGLKDDEIDFAVQTVWLAYRDGQNFEKRKAIDFCDMVWGCIVSGIPITSRYRAVFVDEAQDLSEPQFALIEKLVAPGGKLILVGDLKQAIYGWRGAVGNTVWATMRQKYNAKTLPLTMTWRCPKDVVKTANELVPQLRARPNAPAGEVRAIQFDKLAPELKRSNRETFVLSRTNAMLLRVALELWKAGARFTLNGGAELITPLFWVIEKLDLTSRAKFEESAKRWYDNEQKRAESAGSAEWGDRIEDQFKMLMIAVHYAEFPVRVAGLLRDVLGTERKTSITLSTVHKVKGLEADSVYLLKETFHRHRKPDPRWGDWRPPTPPEELNIEYVGITRARETLTWVEFPDDALTMIAQVKGKDTRDALAWAVHKDGMEGAIARSALKAKDMVDPDDHDEAFDEATMLARSIYGEGAHVMLDGRISYSDDDGNSCVVDPLRELERSEDPIAQLRQHLIAATPRQR